MATQSGAAMYVFFETTTFANPVIIDDEDQLEDGGLTMTTMNFDHRNQRSAAPARKIRTGKEGTINISIGNMDAFDTLAIALGAEISGTGADESLEISDGAGLPYLEKRLLVLPYYGIRVSGDPKTWSYFPLVQLVSEEFNLQYGLETQQSYSINPYVIGNSEGIKLVKGSLIQSKYNVPTLSTFLPANVLPSSGGGGTPTDPLAGWDSVLTIVTDQTPVNDTVNNTYSLNASAGDAIGYDRVANPDALPGASNIKLNGVDIGLFQYPANMANRPIVFKDASANRIYTGNTATPLLLIENIELSDYAFVAAS